MTIPSHQRFVERLWAQVPGFEAVYEKHLHDYDELLAHVLLGDLVRFLEREVRLHGSRNVALDEALDLLDAGMGDPHEDLQNLIGVSFIENRDPREEETYSVFRSLFGPNLESRFKAQQAEVPSQ